MFYQPNHHDQTPIMQQQSDEKPSLYNLVYLLLFLLNIWYKFSSLERASLFTAVNLFIALYAGIAAGIWTIILMIVDFYLWPAFKVWFQAGLNTAVVTPDEDRREVQQQARPLPQAVTPAPVVNLPTHEQVTIETDDNRVLVGNRMVDLLDYDLTLDHWNLLVIARRRGRMPTISPTMLKEKFGIDNMNETETMDSDAHRVIAMLEELELIENIGYRQPYRFTELGDRVLPTSPTEPVAVH
jgi:hypothetical protein